MRFGHSASAVRERACATIQSFTALIDVRPAQLHLERASTECSGCNLVPFLNAAPGVGRHPQLGRVRDFFNVLPDIEWAVAHHDERFLRKQCDRIGAVRAMELVAPAASPRFDSLPKIRALPVWPQPFGAETQKVDGSLDWVLLQPSGDGPARILEEMRTVTRAGVRNVLIGYYEHAAATENWSDFCESDGFEARWRNLLEVAGRLGLQHLGFMMPFPACASLQWGAHVELEAIRARMDLHLRVIDRESSHMCAENVSGYSLTNDVRTFVARFLPNRFRLTFRVEDVILGFDPK